MMPKNVNLHVLRNILHSFPSGHPVKQIEHIHIQQHQHTNEVKNCKFLFDLEWACKCSIILFPTTMIRSRPIITNLLRNYLQLSVANFLPNFKLIKNFFNDLFIRK